MGASGAIASDLQHKLQRLNLNAQAYVDPHLQAMSAAYLTEADVVLAISHSGSSRVVVDNVRIARENGAKVISLTNIGRSPLSKLADVSLFTASQETKFRILAISSRIAELTILDCIYTYIALHTDGANSMKVEKAMELYDRYAKQALDLMLAKNHDYDEAWRSMRISSYTDLILMKIHRTKQIEGHDGATLVSEGIDANYMDMINYSVFGLIKLEFGE